RCGRLEPGSVSGTGDVACQCPADERVGVAVPHTVLGFEVPHDVHVLLQATARDDLLPLADRAPVLLFDGREVRGRSLLRPWRRLLDHGGCSSLRLPQFRRSGRTGLIAGDASLIAGGATLPSLARSSFRRWPSAHS